MAFIKVNRLKSWVVGSLVSETGSEYLFGYDQGDDGLMWLERSGVEYGPADGVWAEAERVVRASVVGPTTPTDYDVPEDINTTGYVIPKASAEMGRPKTVTKSIAGYGPKVIPTVGDPRVVGDFGRGEEFEDEEISAQAAAYLQGLEEE